MYQCEETRRNSSLQQSIAPMKFQLNFWFQIIRYSCNVQNFLLYLYKHVITMAIEMDDFSQKYSNKNRRNYFSSNSKYLPLASELNLFIHYFTTHGNRNTNIPKMCKKKTWLVCVCAINTPKSISFKQKKKKIFNFISSGKMALPDLSFASFVRSAYPPHRECECTWSLRFRF